MTHPLPTASAATTQQGAVELEPHAEALHSSWGWHGMGRGPTQRGQDSGTLGKGHLLQQGGTDPVPPQSLSSILPAHWTSRPLCFQPEKKAGSRSSRQGMGMPPFPLLHGASSAAALLLPLPQHSRQFLLSDSLLQPFLEITKNNRDGSSSHTCLHFVSSSFVPSLQAVAGLLVPDSFPAPQSPHWHRG